MTITYAKTVHWYPTHLYVDDLLSRFGVRDIASLAYPGTLGWLELDDADPRKKAALLVAADHAVLRLETEQIALADASRDVSAAIDWRATAQFHLQRAGYLRSRPHGPGVLDVPRLRGGVA